VRPAGSPTLKAQLDLKHHGGPRVLDRSPLAVVTLSDGGTALVPPRVLRNVPRDLRQFADVDKTFIDGASIRMANWTRFRVTVLLSD